MALSAVAFPILPGKTEEWRKFIAELNGPRREDFVKSRAQIGAHERTFLQSTPMGDLVIVSLEGDDPGRAFGQFVNSKDPFALWFLERVKAIHGVDLAAMPPGLPSELVIDSARTAVLAR